MSDNEMDRGPGLYFGCGKHKVFDGPEGEHLPVCPICNPTVIPVLTPAHPPASLDVAKFHRYTITGEGASCGYFRLVEDPDGAWVTWAEVEAWLTASCASAAKGRCFHGKAPRRP